jgi:methylated-DNA-protein-cysteine methyltransferase-like protein
MPSRPASRDEIDQRLRATIDAVPRGEVASYGQVAREAGLPGRARRVGWLLRNLPAGSPLPWYRIVGAGGRLSLPAASAAWHDQRRRLEAEGVQVDARGRIDLERFGWQPR